MENGFEIQGTKYKLCKLDAITQFHIVRRTGPILSELIPAMARLGKEQKAMESLSEDEKLEKFALVGGPLMEGVAKLSDDDANRVVFGLLSSVEVQQKDFAGVWSKVATKEALMFPVDLPVMIQLVARAFMFNLSGFFAALPSKG
jgi:hypothetical protein